MNMKRFGALAFGTVLAVLATILPAASQQKMGLDGIVHPSWLGTYAACADNIGFCFTPIGGGNPLPVTVSGPAGNIVILGPLGYQVGANGVTIAYPTDPDIRPGSGSITVVDSGSTTTVSGNNAIANTTGTPTAGSFVTAAINGQNIATVTVAGAGTGTLQAEVSGDGGTSWTPALMSQRGSPASTPRSPTATGIGIFEATVTGKTNFRVRATGVVASAYTVTLTFADGPLDVPNATPAPLCPGWHGASLASAIGLSLPTGIAASGSCVSTTVQARYAVACARTASVNYTFDGSTTPTGTVGTALAVGACVPLDQQMIANFKAFSTTGTLDVEYAQ